MLQHRELGATGIMVSPLGLGTVKFGRNTAVKYQRQFLIPSDKEITTLLELAQECNINLLDTAPAYGNSEERLGTLLKAHREKWVIATKVGEEFDPQSATSSYNFTSEHITASIRRSLKNLQTDYLDIVLVHSNGNDVEIMTQYDVFASLQKFKDQGIIRAFGMSTKTVPGGKQTIEQADLAMVTYNPMQQHEKPVLDCAHDLRKGVFIKKAFLSGDLKNMVGKNPIQRCMEFVYAHPAVSSIIIGTINPRHLRQNVLAACMALSKQATSS